jgi:hypothetical protein
VQPAENTVIESLSYSKPEVSVITQMIKEEEGTTNTQPQDIAVIRNVAPLSLNSARDQTILGTKSASGTLFSNSSSLSADASKLDTKPREALLAEETWLEISIRERIKVRANILIIILVQFVSSFLFIY